MNYSGSEANVLYAWTYRNCVISSLSFFVVNNPLTGLFALCPFYSFGHGAEFSE